MHHALKRLQAHAAEADTASAVVDSGAVQGDGSLVPRQVRLFSAWGIEI